MSEGRGEERGVGSGPATPYQLGLRGTGLPVVSVAVLSPRLNVLSAALPSSTTRAQQRRAAYQGGHSHQRLLTAAALQVERGSAHVAPPSPH